MPRTASEAQPCSPGTAPAEATPCVLSSPPERALLDRLALALEGGGRGEPIAVLLDLTAVLPPEDAARVADVVAFYRAPERYAVRAGLVMAAWSRLCMRLFGALFRQNRMPARSPDFAGYPICQRVYRDGRDRPHWDRYARVDGRLERLFVARLERVGGRVRETFVLFGVPVHLVFDARVEGDMLALTMAPLRSSPLAWPARVSYRTRRVDGSGALRTDGEFRIPCLGLEVRTVFHMTLA